MQLKVFIVILLLLAGLCCVYIFHKRTIESFENNIELKSLSVPSVKKYVVQTVTNAMKTIRPDTQGPPGQMGPPGKAGRDGGLFSNKGILRSIQYPTMFLDRDTNKVFVSKRSYEPQQTWMRSSDNKIRSMFNQNQCLSTQGDSGDSLQITSCAEAIPWNYIERTGQLQTLTPVEGKNMCVSIINKSGNKKNGNNYDVKIKECVVTPSQGWSFF